MSCYPFASGFKSIVFKFNRVTFRFFKKASYEYPAIVTNDKTSNSKCWYKNSLKNSKQLINKRQSGFKYSNKYCRIFEQINLRKTCLACSEFSGEIV